MLIFVFLLAGMSTFMELAIAAKIPAWRRLAHKSALFNIINSMALSYVIGIAFGAQGLIAMTAGVLSTLMSIPGYNLLHWAYDSETAKNHGGDMFAYHRARWKQAFVDLGNMIYKIIRVITFPIWVTRAIIVKTNKLFARSRA
jgi:hypothetical protein